MSYLSLVRISVGRVGVQPGQVNMVTSDNLATITAAGYLNKNGNIFKSVALSNDDVIECLYSYNVMTRAGTLAYFQPSIVNGIITLNIWENPGNVLLPVVAGDFAVFNGTAGQIKDAGYLPSNAAKTVVVMAGSAVVTNNIAHFVDTAGTIDDTAAAVTNMGNIYAGASGTAGLFRSYPSAATSGYLGLTGVANSGDFAVQIANASHGQASIYTIVDSGNAAARFLIGATATPFVSGEFPVASGTGGLMVSSGLAAANVQNKTNIKAALTADIGGGGAGAISVVVAGLVVGSPIVATIASSSNVVSVAKCIATATGFDITFSGDPGAACVVNYVAFIAAQ